MSTHHRFLCSFVLFILAINPVSFALAAPSITNNQCQPGPESGNNGINSNCIDNSNPNGWKTGLNQGPFSKGQSVPFRATMKNVVQGDEYTLVIEWDITAGSQFAYDYVTTFNRTLTNADVCTDHAVNAICTDVDTIAIPTDPQITAGLDGEIGTVDDITQEPGELTIYGGTFVSATYTLSGSEPSGDGSMGSPYIYPASSSRNLTIVYTSDQANAQNSGPVVAWSGHIARNGDWGAGNADPSGSPYHMRFVSWDCPSTADCSTGQQDLALAPVDPETTWASIGTVRIEAVDVNAYLDSVGEAGLVKENLDPDGDGQLALFQWETLAEHGTIGFNIERQSSNGDWVRINDRLLPSLLSPLGGEYMLVDPGVTAGNIYKYRLIELEAKGGMRQYGPFTLEY